MPSASWVNRINLVKSEVEGFSIKKEGIGVSMQMKIGNRKIIIIIIRVMSQTGPTIELEGDWIAQE